LLVINAQRAYKAFSLVTDARVALIIKLWEKMEGRRNATGVKRKINKARFDPPQVA